MHVRFFVKSLFMKVFTSLVTSLVKSHGYISAESTPE
jgi:hypothetical protein